MQWNAGAIDAARDAIKTVNEAIDTISMKTTQLEALLVTLTHAARTNDMPSAYLESVCWLAAEIASDIRKSADKLM